MSAAFTIPEGVQAAETTVFAARLEPNPPLGPRGTFAVLAGVAIVGIAVSIPFYLAGAWPVFGFFGLDVLALYVAFRICRRRAAGYEELLLTPVELRYRKVTGYGRTAEWRFNPAWVRVQSEAIGEFGLRRLALVEGRRSLAVATCLGAREKADFASALTSALGEARRR